jgi:hypothetical protein
VVIYDELLLLTLDAEKAFDKLNHEILFNKLYYKYGIKGDMWVLLRRKKWWQLVLNRENPVQSLSNMELDVFLMIHHAQCNIIHFHLPGLQGHIIISPPYLVNALSSIVTHKPLCIGQRPNRVPMHCLDDISLVLLVYLSGTLVLSNSPCV